MKSHIIKDCKKYKILENGKVIHIKKNTEKKQRLDKDGYLIVSLYNDNMKRCIKKIHRLLGEYFILNPKNYQTIDHINRDKLDNRLENLRWASYKTQSINQTRKSKIGEKYIRKTGKTYRVRLRWINKEKSFKTLEEAKKYRDKWLGHL